MTLDANEIRRVFFGTGNDLSLEDSSDPIVEAAERELKYLREHPETWVVLPRYRGTAVGWYGLASTPEAERQMREALRAFVGPSYGAVGLSRRTLRDDDPLESALGQSGVRYATLVRPLQSMPELEAAILDLIATRHRAPESVERALRPLGLIIRDFHLALSLSDERESDRLLKELSESAQIRSENIRYLTFERLASLGLWDELAHHPWFDAIAVTRRPKRTSEVMLEAVWEAYLAPVASDVALLRQAYEDLSLGDRYRGLINSIETTPNQGVRRMLVLSSALEGERARLERLISEVDPTEQLVLRAIAAAGPAKDEVEIKPRRELRAAFEDGRHEEVLQLALDSQPSGFAVETALRSAEAVGDPSSALQALQVFDGAEAGVQLRIQSDKIFGPLVGRLRARSELRCSGWPEWFQRLAVGSWPSAPEAAHLGWDGWSRDFLDSHDQVDSAAEALIVASEAQERGEIHAVIGLVARLLAEETDRVASSSLRVAALMVLGEELDASALVRNALADLLSVILRSDPTANEYDDVVGALNAHWAGVRAFEAFDWLLDCADLLALHRSPDPRKREDFLASIVADGARFAHRIERHQAVLVNRLLEECEVEYLRDGEAWLELSKSSDRDVWEAVTDKLIGLYSLLERAAQSFKSRVGDLNPRASVELNSDTHGSERLKSMAQRADYLVVDTHHAQHAATDAIDDVRPRSDQVFPRGKGVSSFLAALRDRLELEWDI